MTHFDGACTHRRRGSSAHLLCRVVATWCLAGAGGASASPPVEVPRCQSGPQDWLRFGANVANTHSTERCELPGCGALKPLWQSDARASITGQPVSDGAWVFSADWAGQVIARELRTGAIQWTAQLPGGPDAAAPRTLATPLIVEDSVYVTEHRSAILFKLRKATGEILWSRTLGSNPFHQVTGSPALARWRGRDLIIQGLDAGQNALYLRDDSGAVVYDGDQPVAAYTDVPRIPGQQRFDVVGHVIAVDGDSGEIVWDTPTGRSPEESGIGVWSTAAIDEGRGRLYIGTGQAYAPPASTQACAILGLDLGSGAIRQVMSFVPESAEAAESCVWSAAYPGGVGSPAADPDLPGPAGDSDLGSSPVLYSLRVGPRGGTRHFVTAMNKAGRIRAFDRIRGDLIWERQFSMTSGSISGNPGVAYADGVVYASVLHDTTQTARAALDLSNGEHVEQHGGAFISGLVFVNQTTLVALDAVTGEVKWTQSNLTGHTRGAPTVSGGVLYQTGLSGELRAFDANRGELLDVVATPLIDLSQEAQILAPLGTSASAVGDVLLAGTGQGFTPTDGFLVAFELDRAGCAGDGTE